MSHAERIIGIPGLEIISSLLQIIFIVEGKGPVLLFLRIAILSRHDDRYAFAV